MALMPMQTKVPMPNLLNLLCLRPFTAEWPGKDYPTESQPKAPETDTSGRCLPVRQPLPLAINFHLTMSIIAAYANVSNMQHSCATAQPLDLPPPPPPQSGGRVSGGLCVTQFSSLPVTPRKFNWRKRVKIAEPNQSWIKNIGCEKSKWKQSENVCMYYAFAYSSRRCFALHLPICNWWPY